MNPAHPAHHHACPVGAKMITRATFAWAVFLEGYFTTPVTWLERLAFCAVALVIIFAPTGHAWWWAGCTGFIGLVAWVLLLRPRALSAAS